MSRSTELAKNTAILTIGKVCTQSISFFLLPFYTAVLSTEEYGTYDLFLTYATLLLPLVNWQMDQGLFRFMLERRGNNEKITALFSTLFCTSIIQGVIYTVLFILIVPFLHIQNSYFLLLYVLLHIFTQLLLQFVRGLGKSVKYTVASFISASSTTVFNVIFLVFIHMGLTGLFFSTIVAQILTLIYLVFTSKCWRYFSFSKTDMSLFKSVCRFSVPLVPNNLAWWVVNASDRTIISYFINAGANGIYTVANKFPHVFISFYNILNLSLTETISVHFNDEDREEFLTETLTSLFKLFASACFVIVAAMPFIFPIIVNKKYEESYNQILILMYAMFFRVLVGLFSCIYIAQKDVKKVASTSMAAAAINIVVDLLLIKKIGVYAASISTLVAFFAMFIIRYIPISRTLNIKIAAKTLVSTIIMGLFLAVTYYCGNIIIQALALIVTVTYAVIYNLDMIKVGYNIVTKKLGLKKVSQNSAK